MQNKIRCEKNWFILVLSCYKWSRINVLFVLLITQIPTVEQLSCIFDNYGIFFIISQLGDSIEDHKLKFYENRPIVCFGNHKYTHLFWSTDKLGIYYGCEIMGILHAKYSYREIIYYQSHIKPWLNHHVTKINDIVFKQRFRVGLTCLIRLYQYKLQLLLTNSFYLWSPYWWRHN